jgi:signal recognition particle subunit SEC65
MDREDGRILLKKTAIPSIFWHKVTPKGRKPPRYKGQPPDQEEPEMKRVCMEHTRPTPSLLSLVPQKILSLNQKMGASHS